jgi:ATP-dependent DNA helicase UvrD/PcrA
MIVKAASATGPLEAPTGGTLTMYFADLHIHSKYSRATSKNCNLMELARWAALKGILILATGDFTHPEWSREIEEMLEVAENGLLALKKEYVPKDTVVSGGFGPEDVRFILNVELSSIYKKAGVTRKIHNLVFMPDIDSVKRFNARLDRMGNIKSDGRPILGVDSKVILEIALETSQDSFVIPAHVWTPWFSVLGSKSGFDSIEECFDDLAPHVFALETGLSSDPEMNHMVSSLDNYTLISNSDTHSPAKLGREANVFDGPPGYDAIREAIRRGGDKEAATGDPDSGWGVLEHSGGEPRFVGTIEFFPEEGKYHLDGHRKCGTRLDPEETAKLNGRCPVCGQRVTVGVMNRVMELADREKSASPRRAAPFWRMVPLAEIIAQAIDVGPSSKKVAAAYIEMVRKLGPELSILWSQPLDHIGKHAPEIVVEAIRRVRTGKVSIKAGFDGEYGTVELFGPGEREAFAGQTTFVPVTAPGSRRSTAATRKARGRKKSTKSAPEDSAANDDSRLNTEQEEAVTCMGVPVLVQAGPGTGKTRTLACRIAALIREHGVEAQKITAVTFTRKAAGEMRDRLAILLSPEQAAACGVGTFHQLGSKILRHFQDISDFRQRSRILDEDEAFALFRQGLNSGGNKSAPAEARSRFEEVGLLKQDLVTPDDSSLDHSLARAYSLYEEQLVSADACDLDDLLTTPVRLLRDNPSQAAWMAGNVSTHLLVDEFQDVNRAQYEMTRLLARPNGEGLFAIGDPDQAIYGFRGSDVRFFHRFTEDYSSTRHIRLTRNYRSYGTILRAARDVIAGTGSEGKLIAEKPGSCRVKIVNLPNPATEAEFIVRTIDSILGGTSFYSMDSGRVESEGQKLGFKDFAVLYRLNAVGDALEKAFQSSSIPFQRACRSNPREEAEELDPTADAVTLMTIHASKGLEFPVVFVAGCEDGIIPCTLLNGRRSSDPEEEKRLFYVAVTRAAQELFLIHCRRRTLFGKDVSNSQSRFLSPISPSVCESLEPLAGRRPRGPRQCDLFG